MTTIQTKEELDEKVGKKSFLADEITIAAKLNYKSGIQTFDEYLNGQTLTQINAVIHLSKYPKGLIIKIVQNFSSVPFGLSYLEIKRTILTERPNKSILTFERDDNSKIIFNLLTNDISTFKEFLDGTNLKYVYEKIKAETIIKENKPVNNIKYGVPALLSFVIPGLGQLIKRHFVKAIAIWCSGILTMFVFYSSVISGQFGISILTYLIPFLIWLWNVYDAYNSHENWGTSENNID